MLHFSSTSGSQGPSSAVLGPGPGLPRTGTGHLGGTGALRGHECHASRSPHAPPFLGRQRVGSRCRDVGGRSEPTPVPGKLCFGTSTGLGFRESAVQGPKSISEWVGVSCGE